MSLILIQKSLLHLLNDPLDWTHGIYTMDLPISPAILLMTVFRIFVSQRSPLDL